MKVLHLCTYDVGGAANAALRLHDGLLEKGIESRFASKRSTVPGPGRFGVVGKRWDWLAANSPRIEFHLARLLHFRVRPVITRDYLPGCGLRALEGAKPDIVHLHWVAHGFIRAKDLTTIRKLGIPMVWTLHDMSPLAGGFGFRESVGLPPAALGPLVCPDARQQASAGIIAEREKALAEADLTVVAPSRWLADESRGSPVFRKHRIEVIPYGIDTGSFAPELRDKARIRWRIDGGTRVILFGADTFEDSRKGIHHLKAALTTLAGRKDCPPLLVIGFGNREELRQEDFPVPVRGVGRLSDPADIAELYAASDVFACPSREDNFPNTMVESLACGTPVVGFEIGGLPDMVVDGATGCLAKPYDETALAECLLAVISQDSGDREKMRANCRSLALERLTLSKQAEDYIAVYESMLRG